MTFNIFLFSVFLVLNLWVGLWFGRKVNALRHYAISPKKCSTRTLTTTIIATHMGAGLVCYGLENTYTQGLYFILPCLLICVGSWLTAQVVVVRMEAFLNNLSVAEAMGNLYGKTVQRITALSGILVMVAATAIQFKVISNVLFLTLGGEGHGITLITAGIIIVYSTWGGIRSITLTDILQFLAICVCIPALFLAVYHSCFDSNPITTVLATHPLFNWQQVRALVGWNPQFLYFASLCLFKAFPSIALAPAQFQKIAMSQSMYQAKKTFTHSASFEILLLCIVLLVGMLLLTHTTGLSPQELVNYVAATYTVYPTLKGLLVIGVVAWAMATADASLNTAVVLFVHDIISPCRQTDKQKLVQKEKNKQNQRALLLTRIGSCSMGLLALLLAFQFDTLFQLLMLANSFFMPIYIPPLLLAIFGFRSTPTAVLISMATGGITMVLWRTRLAHTNILDTLPSMLANTVALFISHGLLPKPKNQPTGWVGIPPILLLIEGFAQHTCLQRCRQLVRHPYYQQIVPQNKATYLVFALYVCLAIFIPFLTTGKPLWVNFPTLYRVIFFSVLLPTALFITYRDWEKILPWQPFIICLWTISIGYILFGVSTTLLISHGLKKIPVVTGIVNLLFASLLIPWQMMLAMLVIGPSVALALIAGLADFQRIACWEIHYTPEYKATQGIVLFLSMLIMLYKHQKDKLQLQADKDYQQALLVAYEQDRLHHLHYQALQKAAMEQNVKKSLHTLAHQLPKEKSGIKSQKTAK